MALIQEVKNGQLVESASQASLQKSTSSSDGMDKDTFLQLLVAQMKYQDPLEPTSNTEFVSQYAQFSQVEQMQNMAGSMDLQRASSLVGQEVYIKTTDSNGSTAVVQGKVDFVTFEGGKAYLSVNDSLYSIDDLYSVEDAQYQAGYTKAYNLTIQMNQIPGPALISVADADKAASILETYDGMSDYEKSFVADETKATLEKYREKLEEFERAAEPEYDKLRGILAGLPDADTLEEFSDEDVDALEQLKETYNKLYAFELDRMPEDLYRTVNAYLTRLEELTGESGAETGNADSAEDAADGE